ncbi:uncharacterized protein LOC127787218 isoform X2 [Diospyros lotus]|uniref:uncharacterized protein LOC127787218 isoform X2 n=1 Tax=Diospyros lotus TaxID=55363 RepID=UPI00225A23E2|nr:uncharacterized protein LOC127787218 isoform X2 [Diospyros lotus]
MAMASPINFAQFNTIIFSRRQPSFCCCCCASSSAPPRKPENTTTNTSRRLVSISVAFFSSLSVSLCTDAAIAGSFLDKYVKRKKLDPLEAYVPAVILTQLQIEDLGKTLETDQPQYGSCRNLLRSGPAASLRINIRAVAQYAVDSGNGKTAFQSVDQCLRALEELDSLLLRASRNDGEASVESMKTKIGTAIDALDRFHKHLRLRCVSYN